MSDSGNRRKPNLTLERLLQVKRSERPAPSFWEEFDRELRRRQLAAFVMVQPWHVKAGRAAMALLRKCAPIGAAAAALAAGVVAWDVREHPAPAAQVAEIDPDSRPVVFPEAHFGPSAEAGAAAAAALAAAPRRRACYIVQELRYAQSVRASYITDASPITLSLADPKIAAHQLLTLSMSNSGPLGSPGPASEGL